MKCSLRASRVGNMYVWRSPSICLGPDYLLMLTSCLFILTASALFVCFCVVFAARVVCGVWAALTVCLMLRCATADPGVCPRAAARPDAAPHHALAETVTYTNSAGREQQAAVMRKWCYKCHAHRPVRAVHCRFCDVCVARRDHHCPWVGTCVGARNYRFYWPFLWAILGLALTVLLGGIDSIRTRARDAHAAGQRAPQNPYFAAVLQSHFVEPMLVLVALAVCCLVAPLATYHALLVTRNMTTLEEMRGGEHYFNKGSCWSNTGAALCGAAPPSVLFTLNNESSAELSPHYHTAVEVVISDTGEHEGE